MFDILKDIWSVLKSDPEKIHLTKPTETDKIEINHTGGGDEHRTPEILQTK